MTCPADAPPTQRPPDAAQLLLSGGASRVRTRDDVYTPLPLARAVVSLVLTPRISGPVMEPHVGGGAFLLAVSELRRGHHRYAVDVDSRVRGLALAHTAHVGSFLDLTTVSPRPQLIIGNPPFSDAPAHVAHALRLVRPGGDVALLLPLSDAGSGRLDAVYQAHGLPRLVPVLPRPWKGSREIALYWWRTGPHLEHHNGTWGRLRWR